MDFSNNQLTHIEAGALEGHYSEGSFIDVSNNNLTRRLELAVFQSFLLQQFAAAYITHTKMNRIDCIG